MPSLYPENKSYGPEPKEIIKTDFQSSMKKIKADLEKRKVAAAEASKAKANAPLYAGGLVSDPSASTLPSLVTPNFKTGSIIAPEANKSMPLSSYPKSTPIEAKVGADATIKTLPTFLGGGQYTQNPATPEKNVKWFAGDRKQNAEEDALVKAGYNPSYFEIDHEIPLGLGGADTLGNKVILSKPDHALKSKIQQVFMQLDYDKVISAKEAQAMAINWRSYIPYADMIPEQQDANGNFTPLSSEQAKKLLNKFKKEPSVTWKTFLGGLKDAPKAIENPMGRELFKGMASWGIPGIDLVVPELADIDEYDNPTYAKQAKIGQFIGSTIGGILGLATGGAILKGASKALKLRSAALNLTSKGRAILKAEEAAKVLAEKEAITAAGKVGQSVIEKSGIDTVDKAVASRPWISSYSPVGALTKQEFMTKSLEMGALNAALMQIRTQDEGENGLGARTQRALGDFALGAFSGGDPLKVGSYARTMAVGTIISTMMGDDFTTAVKNGAVMTGFHGLSIAGALKNKKGLAVTPEQIDDALESALIGKSKEIRALYTNGRYDPKKAGNSADMLDAENFVLLSNMADKAVEEGWTLAKMRTEARNITLSGRNLYKQGLSPEARMQANLDDITTFRSKLKSGRLTPNDRPEALNKLEIEVNKDPNYFKNRGPVSVDDAVPVEGDMHAVVAGAGKEDLVYGLNAKRVKKSATDFPGDTNYHVVTPEENPKVSKFYGKEENKDILVGNAIFVKVDVSHEIKVKELGIERRINKGTATAEDKAYIKSKNPDKAVKVFAPVTTMDKTGKKTTKYVDLGFVSRKSNQAFNETIDTPEGPKKEFNTHKDDLFDKMTQDGLELMDGTVTIIFDTKSGKPKILATIKPKHLADSKTTTQMVLDAKVAQNLENVQVALNNKPGKKVEEVIAKDGTPAVVAEAPAKINPELLKKPTPVQTDIMTAIAEKKVADTPDINDATNFKPLQAEIDELKAPVATIKKVEEPINPDKYKGNPLIDEVKPTVRENQTVAENLGVNKPKLKPMKNVNYGYFTNDKIFGGPVQDIMAKFPDDVPTQKRARASFSEKEMKRLVTEIKGKVSNLEDGADEFTKQIKNKMQALTNEQPNLNKTKENALAKYYKKESEQFIRPLIKFGANGKMEIVNKPERAGNLKGKADKSMEEYSAAKGLGKEEVSFVTIDTDPVLTDAKGEKITDTKQKVLKIFEHFRVQNAIEGGEKIILVTQKGKRLEDLGFVKVSSKAATKMVDDFNANPKKYIGDEFEVNNVNDKILHVYFNDILKVSKPTANEAVKRGSLLFNRFAQYGGKDTGRNVDVHVLTSKTVGEYGGIDKSRIRNAETPEVKKLIEALEGRSVNDGLILVGKSLMARINKGLNKNSPKTTQKPIMSGLTGDGEFMLQKGIFVEIDDAWAEVLKNHYKIKNIDDNAIYSFQDNVKMGNKTPAGGKVSMKMGDLYFRDATYKPGLRMSPSFMTKFLSTDNLSPALSKILGQKKTEFDTFVKDILESQKRSPDSEKLYDVVSKNADKYGWDVEELFYGMKTKMFELGGGKKILGNEIEKLLKNTYMAHVMSPTIKAAGQAKMVPSIIKNWDGKGERALRRDEIVIGAAQAKKLGVTDGDYVITGRNPVTDSTNLVKAKVIVGDKFGLTSLKDEAAMMSMHDTYVNKKGDFDGDTVFMYKLGDDGLPKEFGDALESRPQLDRLVQEVEKRVKTKLSEKDIQDIAIKSIPGNEAVGSSSEIARVITMLDDSKITLRLHGDRVYIMSNGKIVNNIKIKGKTWFNNPTDIKFKNDPASMDLISQVQGFALDTADSDSMLKLTGGDDDFLLKKLLVVKGNALPKEVLPEVKNALSVFHQPFRAMKNQSKFATLDELAPEFKTFNEISKNIVKNGGKLSPIQEIMLNMDDKVGLGLSPKGKTRNREDFAGGKAVENDSPEIKAKLEKQEYSPEVAKIMEKVENVSKEAQPSSDSVATWDEGKRKAEIKKGNIKVGTVNSNGVEYAKYYFTDEGRAEIKAKHDETRKKTMEEIDDILTDGSLSDEDKDILSYWVATSPKANMAQHPSWTKEAQYVDKPYQLLAENEERARKYIDAFEDPSIEEIKGKVN